MKAYDTVHVLVFKVLQDAFMLQHSKAIALEFINITAVPAERIQ